MKRVKITLPQGGHRYSSNNMELSLKEGTVFEIDAPEIVIEGDVSLNQAPAQRIPFDLEAAKAGAQVLWGDDPVRWVARGNEKSSIRSFNIIEHAAGLSYAPDCDLFMVPKAKKARYLNISKGQVDEPGPCWSYSYLTKKEAEEAANIAEHIDWAAIAYPIIID